ncbi:uncharacterized protein LOC127813669 [Diospyros lotus]|uniref:uncharacterized protein LOC127813669 n=1 Tax=Diospyros lotus TaxID=55363 RepID=UPI00224F5033|nr:uncharacterized protein LOC127813669 [Diospyros lotus]XP_052210728.1 uncharacterized protein LOC127813669 [Diospyros lotus]
MAGDSLSASTSLKEYLKRYENKDEEERRKKKKKRKTRPDALGVVVVDEDPVWQKPVKLEDENDDSADEEKPVVDEDIEVKRMKRLEQLRARRAVGAISDDGSGWVSISDTPKLLSSKDEISDISPPYKHRVRNDTPSLEPELKPSGSSREVTDLSPPRKLQRHYDSPSPEPGTKLLHFSGTDSKILKFDEQNSDISPPRKPRARYDTPSPEPDLRTLESGREVVDLSPTRKQKNHHYTRLREPDSVQLKSSGTDLDLSPPRRHVSHKQPSLKQPSKTGLISGQEMKEEITRIKKDDWERYKDMDPSISGRGAEPIFRDKATGARVSKEELMKTTKKDEKPKEIKLEWGKGLAQKREAETRQLELELEKEKPFARTRDDPELDRMLKERVRWGDPMAHLVKRKHSELVLPDLGGDDKMKESGFIIPQEIPSHSWIRRGSDAAPNRYGIKPGRHWDGVDRSNGYEKEMFKRMSEKRATEREAYLWSVSDM